MITEDYVSFETAKLLKEKGFDGECDLFGRTDESELIIREAAKIAYEQACEAAIKYCLENFIYV